MVYRVLISGIVASAACSHAFAQSDWSGVLSEESFAIYDDKNPGFYYNDASISVATSDTLSFDFSAVGDTEFSFTWAAPAGQFIEIAVPDFLASSPFVKLRFGALGSGIFRESDILDYTVFGESGTPLPAVAADMRVYSTGLTAQIVWNNLTPGETYRFQSITGTATASANVQDIIVDATVYEFGIFGSYRSEGDGSDAPGPWIRLVPAPGTAGLFAIGGMVAVRRRRSV
ncbi:MAG: PEP-CTERM sorting domain-containing protein [Phycisphaerales bacterium]|nr:PEP-CTERM sorting domain-containing protein [Phycisphaerales bacterium]